LPPGSTGGLWGGEPDAIGGQGGAEARDLGGGSGGAGGAFAHADSGLADTGGAVISTGGGPGDVGGDQGNADGNPGPGSGGATGTGGGTESGSGGVDGTGGSTASGSGGAIGAGGSTQSGSGGVDGTGGSTASGSGGAGGNDVYLDAAADEGGAGADAVESSPEPDTAADLAEDWPPDLPNPPADAQDASEPDSPDRAEDVPSDSAPPLTLFWSDEFDGTANSAVDTSKWSYVTWGPQNGVNNEKQQYTTSTENVYLDGDGHLVLRGLNTPVEGADYTSGRIETKDKFSFKTGRLEVRAKLPAGKGSFPGIVTHGISGSWPQCGAIGLMEQWGQEKNWFFASAYTDGSADSGDKRSIRHDFPNATTASTDFHVYSVDWYSDTMIFQVDGEEIMRTTFGTSSPFYTTAQYVILDVAIGGNMGGTIDPNGFPMDMVVDYVRVYSF
jgi:beta-glucanase (GH16 family)